MWHDSSSDLHAAKRRKSEDVNSESSSHKSEKTPTTLSLKNVDRIAKTTATSSGELYLDDDGKDSQHENGPRENDLGMKATECSSGENAARDQRERGGCNEEQVEIPNLSDEDLENEMDAGELSGIIINRHGVPNKCCSTGLTTCEIEANNANLQLAEPEESNIESLLLKKSEEELYSATREQNLRIDIPVPGGANSTVNAATSKSTPDVASDKTSISHITACIGKAHAASDNHVIPSTELLKPLSSIDISFEHVRSMDKSDATEVINPGSEFSGTLGELSNSPTTRSFLAYDGSVSSYDGMDEIIPDYQHLNPLGYNNVVDDVSDERPRMAKLLIDSLTYGDAKAHQHLNLSSDFPIESHHVMKAEDRKEFPSKMPLPCGCSQSVYESGGPPNQLLDELCRSSTFLPSDPYEDPEQEKMKLLRMICILQDQLNRSRSVNGDTNGRLFSSTYKEKHTLPYLSHDLQEERFHQAVHYRKCDGSRCNHEINQCQRNKLSLSPSSAEATSSTNQVPLSCFHCFPHEWQCPAELPPYVFQHEGPGRYHHGHSCCSPHYSYPFNPGWNVNSKTSLYSCETKSDYHRHQAYEVKKYPREKQYLANRHVRPVAGGAPFVTCHHCFRLLQLPADFLLYKKAFRELKCGSCSEVLKFSLMKPYERGKLNSQSKVVNGSNRTSQPDANCYNSSPAGSISYSDNYVLSASKSCFSEDPVSLSAFRSLHVWGYDHCVSGGISAATTENEQIASSPSIDNPIGTGRSDGLVSNVLMSKKVSSQTDARPPPPPRSSQLHQLMGYTSLSQVIRGTKSSSKCNIMVNGAGSDAK